MLIPDLFPVVGDVSCVVTHFSVPSPSGIPPDKYYVDSAVMLLAGKEKSVGRGSHESLSRRIVDAGEVQGTFSDQDAPGRVAAGGKPPADRMDGFIQSIRQVFFILPGERTAGQDFFASCVIICRHFFEISASRQQHIPTVEIGIRFGDPLRIINGIIVVIIRI